MLNNLGSAEAWDGNGGGDGGQGNGLVVPDLQGGRRPHHHHHSYPEEGEVEEEEPRLPQIWISKSASMELDLI
jgi:hypothetical protein